MIVHLGVRSVKVVGFVVAVCSHYETSQKRKISVVIVTSMLITIMRHILLQKMFCESVKICDFDIFSYF